MKIDKTNIEELYGKLYTRKGCNFICVMLQKASKWDGETLRLMYVYAKDPTFIGKKIRTFPENFLELWEELK